MAYTPQTWVDNNASYPLSAARMNTMESGISAAASVADQGHRILTTTQRDALTGVTAGTMIYNSTLNRIQVYFNSAWVDADQFRTVGANNYSTRIVPPMCRVRRATTQSIPNVTDTFVSWTLEDIDTDGMFTATSDTITIQTTGVYLVAASVYFAANATGQRVVNLMKSPTSASDLGAAFAQSWFPVASATNPSTLSASGLVSCIAGDTIKIVVYQTSGGALNIADTGFTSATQCSIAWVGRTS